MKSFERDFLEHQAIPIEFAGTLRLLGEYRGKQELYTKQMPQVLNTLRQAAIIQSDVLNRVSAERYRVGHSLVPWWEYNLGLLLEAYREFENRVGAVRSSRGTKTAWIVETLEHLPNEFEIREIVRACPGVSRPMIRTVLEALRKEGKLKNLGTGRGAKWQKVILTDNRDNKRDNKGRS